MRVRRALLRVGEDGRQQRAMNDLRTQLRVLREDRDDWRGRARDAERDAQSWEERWRDEARRL